MQLPSSSSNGEFARIFLRVGCPQGSRTRGNNVLHKGSRLVSLEHLCKTAPSLVLTIFSSFGHSPWRTSLSVQLKVH